MNQGSVPLLFFLVSRGKKKGGASPDAIQQQYGIRRFDAGQVIKIVVLPERNVRPVVGQSMQNRNRFSDPVDQCVPPCGKVIPIPSIPEADIYY
jgi:hypothetical protein